MTLVPFCFVYVISVSHRNLKKYLNVCTFKILYEYKRLGTVAVEIIQC